MIPLTGSPKAGKKNSLMLKIRVGMGGRLFGRCTRELHGIMVMFCIFFWVVIAQVYTLSKHQTQHVRCVHFMIY